VAILEEIVKMSITWLINVFGIIFSGIGTFILAYDILSYRPKNPIGTLSEWDEEGDHKRKNQNLIKVAMVLILLGTGLQLLSQFLDP